MIPNIKVPSYDKDVIDVDFSILEMLQSQLGQVRVYINKKVNGTAIEKQNVQNIFMVKNIIFKRKTHKEKVNIDVRDNIRKIFSL